MYTVTLLCSHRELFTALPTASPRAWRSTMSLNLEQPWIFVLTGYLVAHHIVYLNRPGSCLDTIVGSAGERTCSRSHCEIEGFEYGEFHGVYTADITCGCPGYAWLHLGISRTCQHRLRLVNGLRDGLGDARSSSPAFVARLGMG